MQERLMAPLARITSLDPVVREWPRGSRRVAEEMVRSYGLPHEATQNLLIWHYADPWKQVVVHRTGALHRFPFQHRDYLEQTIDLRVPAERCGELALFNGSVVVNRTRGEVTVHCSSEAANFVLINLVHDIVLGKLSAREAREACASTAAALLMRWPVAHAAGLSFTPDTTLHEGGGVTADPDRMVLAMPTQ
jgi:hypothetical protein